jgi:phage gp29-like protein
VIDNAAADLKPADLQNQMEGVLKPVLDLIKKGTSFDDILTSLAEAYPNMDNAALQEMLSRAIFVSEVWGRLNAKTK